MEPLGLLRKEGSSTSRETEMLDSLDVDVQRKAHHRHREPSHGHDLHSVNVNGMTYWAANQIPAAADNTTGFDMTTSQCAPYHYTFVCDVTMGWYHGLKGELSRARCYSGPTCHEYRFVLGSKPDCERDTWCKQCSFLPPAVCEIYLERNDTEGEQIFAKDDCRGW